MRNIITSLVFTATLIGCSGNDGPSILVANPDLKSDSGVHCSVGILGCSGDQPTICTESEVWQNVGASCSGSFPVCYKGACIALDASADVMTNDCVIDGVKYADTAFNPNNSCQQCQYNVSSTEWSNYTGLSTGCSNNWVCNNGACSQGCYIDGLFYQSGATNPKNVYTTIPNGSTNCK